MGEILTVVTRKGQITVPVRIREALGLHEGDRVAWSLSEGEAGQVILRPARSVAEATYGVFPAPEQPIDFEALRAEFEETVAKDVIGDLSDARGSA